MTALSHTTKSRRGGRPPKYPWRTMEVGDSFLAFGVSGHQIRNTARTYHRPKVFTTRTVQVHGVVGVRVWRIA